MPERKLLTVHLVSSSRVNKKTELLVSSPTRKPPTAIAINADPPFELNIVSEMAAARGGDAATSLGVFVDDLDLGSIQAGLAPPVPIEDRQRKIGDNTRVFGLDPKEMRVFTKLSTMRNESLFVRPGSWLRRVPPRK